MLTQLTIVNYALIDQLDLKLSSGFSTITGETGAGKSIILGALGLVLGQRADWSVVQDQEKKCIIEAHFDISNLTLAPFFEQHDLEFDPHTIIRREILPGGKSRAFVNDSPVHLGTLNLLSEQLIDVHSQQDNRNLNELEYQYDLLDAWAGTGALRTAYQKQRNLWTQAKKELDLAKTQLKTWETERDYAQFVYQELTEAQLDLLDLHELEAKQKQLTHLDTIREHLTTGLHILHQEESGLMNQLLQLKINVGKIAGYHQDYETLEQRIASVYVELQDCANELELKNDQLEQDPAALLQVNAQLELIYLLQRKHQLNTITELIGLRDRLSDELLQNESATEHLAQLEKQVADYHEKAVEIAADLHRIRKAALPHLTAAMETPLKKLGMPDVQFAIELTLETELLPLGTDKLRFELAVNKGTQPGLIGKVASGGEKSRIMLVVKSILAAHTALPTLILDEIDTGVSGEVATKMAEMMAEMGKNRQLIAITHLPQIAAKGANQYKVSKSSEGQKTTTSLRLLSHAERIAELAEMISGKNPNESALSHAAHLLN
ncbi:MAG: DNA repair protein RecN [Flavobacterium sp. BFFFF2]|nr:MAG: DNA repair protein RecN [Flavobacterium sp. BFFFF2]